MQKGKKVHEEQARPISRKNQSPKKGYNNLEQLGEQEAQSANMKKLKINSLNLNELKEKSNSKHAAQVEMMLAKEQEIISSCKSRENAEDSSRNHNPYYEMHRADLKYYGEYIESCQKITNNGINYKWPYCFYNGS